MRKQGIEGHYTIGSKRVLVNSFSVNHIKSNESQSLYKTSKKKVFSEDLESVVMKSNGAFAKTPFSNMEYYL